MPDRPHPSVRAVIPTGTVAKTARMVKLRGGTGVATIPGNGVGKAPVRDKTLLVPVEEGEEGVGGASAAEHRIGERGDTLPGGGGG